MQIHSSPPHCKAEDLNPMIPVLYLAYHSIRSSRLRHIYLLPGELELYEYQGIQYDGTMREVLETKKEMDDRLYDMLHINLVEDLIVEHLPPLKNYNSFTNPKFMEEERVDALFVKNTLLEFATLSLIKVVVFFLLNRLFYCFFNYSLSRFLRLYSFKVFLIEVLILGDIQSLVFILLRNFSCLFKIGNGIQYLAVALVPVIFGGIILFFFLYLFPFQRSIHGKLSKYFLTNMYRVNGSLLISCLLFTAKPILTSSVQALLYVSPSIQLTLLGIIELIALVSMWVFQLKYDLFINKKLFCIDSLLTATMSLLNLCCYLKFLYLSGNEAARQVLEQIISTLVKFILVLMFLSFIINCLCALETPKYSQPEQLVSARELK